MSKVHIYSNKQARSISNIEQKMRNYINAWNTNDLKTDILFDDLYQPDFHGIYEGKQINLKELKQLHRDKLSRFDQCRLIYFRRVGACAYDTKLTFFSKEGGEFSIRRLLTVEDDRIGGAIDYNGTIAPTKSNEKGYGLSYYWHIPLYLLSRNEIARKGKRIA